MGTTLSQIRVNLDPYWDDLTNQEVADALNININTVSAYRNGNVKNPKIEVLIKFKEFFAHRTGKKLILEDLLKIESNNSRNLTLKSEHQNN